MPTIFFSIPWNTEKNLGKSYNQLMERLHEDEYACFIDGDAMFTTTFFGKQLEKIVEKYPECGIFVGKTNRIGCEWQREGGDFAWNYDHIPYHREIGLTLQKEKETDITDQSTRTDGKLLGGVLILIRKKEWEEIGKFKEDGILGIDNDIHSKAMLHGKKVYCMEGVYLYHYYRGGVSDNKNHLL